MKNIIKGYIPFLIAGVVLCFLSLIFISPLSFSKFGVPVGFLQIEKSQSVLSNSVILWDYTYTLKNILFDKLILNLIFWISLTSIVYLFITFIKRSKLIYLVFALLAFVILFSSFGFYLVNENKDNLKFSTSINSKMDYSRVELVKMKESIEKAYPEFKDFDLKESFAGTKVVYIVIDDKYYFGYLTLGSGVPIADAKCFSFENNGEVKKMDLNRTASSTSLMDVDLSECRMIDLSNNK